MKLTFYGIMDRLFFNGWNCNSLVSHRYFLLLVSYRPAAINTTTYHMDWHPHIVAGGILIAECILPIHHDVHCHAVPSLAADCNYIHHL